MILIIIKILLNLLIVGLFLYSKLLPFKDKLDSKYRNIFGIINSILTPMLNGLKSIIEPFKVGNGISVDMSQIALLIIFLLVNLII